MWAATRDDKDCALSANQGLNNAMVTYTLLHPCGRAPRAEWDPQGRGKQGGTRQTKKKGRMKDQLL